MTYNKISFTVHSEAGESVLTLDPKESKFRIIVDPTSHGLLQWYCYNLQSTESNSEIHNGSISAEVDTFAFKPNILDVLVMKKDSLTIFFGEGRGDSSYYDGMHQDLKGSFRVFVNEGRFWIHLQSKSLSANIPVDFEGYIFPKVHETHMIQKFKASNIKISEIIDTDRYGSEIGNARIALVNPI